METLQAIYRYFFPPNDWKIIWTDFGYWTQNKVRVSQAIYVIEFSKHRKEYRLKCEGDEPKIHHMYAHAVAKLAEFNLLTYTK